MAVTETVDKTIGTINIFEAFNAIFFDPNIMTIPEYIANYFMDFISNFFFILFFIALIINVYKLVFEGVPFKQIVAGTMISFLSIYLLFYIRGWKDAKTGDNATYESYFVTDVVSTVFYLGERAADAFAYNILFGADWETLTDFKLMNSKGIKKDEKVDGYLFTDFYNQAMNKVYSNADKNNYIKIYREKLKAEAKKIEAIKTFVSYLDTEKSKFKVQEHLKMIQQLTTDINFKITTEKDGNYYHFFGKNMTLPSPNIDFEGPTYHENDTYTYKEFITSLENAGTYKETFNRIIDKNINEFRAIITASKTGIVVPYDKYKLEKDLENKFNIVINQLENMKEIGALKEHLKVYGDVEFSPNNAPLFKNRANSYFNLYLAKAKRVYDIRNYFYEEMAKSRFMFYVPYSFHPGVLESNVIKDMYNKEDSKIDSGDISLNKHMLELKRKNKSLRENPSIQKLLYKLNNYMPPENPIFNKKKTLEDYILSGIPMSVSDKYEFHWVDLGLIYSGVITNLESTVHLIAGFQPVDVGDNFLVDVAVLLNSKSEMSIQNFNTKVEAKANTIELAAGSITGALTGMKGFQTIFAMTSGISKPFGALSGIIGGSIGAMLSFYTVIFIVMILLFIIKTMVPAFFWMIGVLNWFIRSSFLMLLLPVSILFAIFTSRRQGLFDNIYKILGQAVVPMVLVATFFLVINAIIVTNIMVKEMVPILDAEKMVNWYSDGINGNGTGNSFISTKTSEIKIGIEARIGEAKLDDSSFFSGIANGALDIGGEIFKFVFNKSFIYNALVSLMAYGISILYFLVTLIMDILLLRYFWKIDDIVGEVMGTSVSNNSFDAEQLFRRFGGKFIS